MTLAEYGLSGVLVLGVCMGTMLAVGNQMESMIGGIRQDMRSRVENGKTIKAALVAQSSRYDVKGTVSKGLLAINPENPDELCSQDGWCVSAPSMTGDSVYTTGSNGMQDLANDASDVYIQMAEIIRKEGGNPELTSLLKDMADQGYSLSNIQKQLSSAIGFPQLGEAATEVNLTLSSLHQQMGEFSGMAEQMQHLISDLPADKQALLDDATTIVLASSNAYSLQSYGDMATSLTADASQTKPGEASIEDLNAAAPVNTQASGEATQATADGESNPAQADTAEQSSVSSLSSLAQADTAEQTGQMYASPTATPAGTVAMQPIVVSPFFYTVEFVNITPTLIPMSCH